MACSSCCSVIRPFRCGLNNVDLKSLLLQLQQRVEHRVMLTGHTDQMAWSTVGQRASPGMAQQRQVVGFGGATGEDQFLGSDPQAARKAFSG